MFKKRIPILQLMVYKTDEDTSDLKALGVDITPVDMKMEATVCECDQASILAEALRRVGISDHVIDPVVKMALQFPAAFLEERELRLVSQEGRER